jgi:hypothetical protein
MACPQRRQHSSALQPVQRAPAVKATDTWIPGEV